MFDFLPEAKRKWVYSFLALQIPKCASSSVAAAVGDRNLIQKHRGLIVEKFAKHPLYRGIFDTRHLLPEHIVAIFSRQIFDYFSFAVVREPISRLISSWQFGKGKKLGKVYGLSDDTSFSEYVDFLYGAHQENRRDILILRPQTDWAASEIFKPTVILKFETLASDWQQMIEQYNISGLPTTLPHENKSQKEKITISADTRRKILTFYQSDIILYPESF